MKKTLKNILQTLIGFIIGAFFLYLTLKNKNLSEIIESIRETDAGWAFLSGIALLFIFLFRAMRWKILLKNSGFHPKNIDVVSSIAVGYFVNSFTPKLGELIRCTSLNRIYDYKVSKLLGTVVSERVYDVLVMFLGVFVVLLFEFERLSQVFDLSALGVMLGTESLQGKLILLIIPFALILLYFIVRKRLKKLSIFNRIRNFIKELYSTVLLTFKIKQYRQFVVLTILIWVALVLMNYCFLMALPETNSFNMYFAVVVLFVGALGWALPTPGGIGTTHYLLLQLFIAFQLNPDDGINFGILSNGLTFVYTIAVGFIAVIFNESRILYLKRKSNLES